MPTETPSDSNVTVTGSATASPELCAVGCVAERDGETVSVTQSSAWNVPLPPSVVFAAPPAGEDRPGEEVWQRVGRGACDVAEAAVDGPHIQAARYLLVARGVVVVWVEVAV